MKDIIAITSLLAAGTLFANAGTTTAVIDFGNGLTTETSGKSADYTFEANSSSSGASNVSLGALTLYNGGVTKNQNVSANPVPGADELFDEAKKYFGDYSANVWADGLTGVDTTSTLVSMMALRFNNLQANTKYTVALFSGFGDGQAWSFGLTNLYLSFYDGSSSKDLSGTHFEKDGPAEGEQFKTFYDENVVSLTDQHLFVWEFETGSEVENVMFELWSTKGFYNALSISATPLSVPEPSMFGLLAGLGALALAGTRRRRKSK